MKIQFVLFTIISFGLVSNAATKEMVILKGKKAQISCARRVASHIFCQTEAFDIPGVCGQGFECIVMKAGEKQTACDTEFSCVEATLPTTKQ